MSNERPSLIAFHVRSGVVALNVVTAALDSDPATAGVEVQFEKSVDALIDRVARAPRPTIVLWSFYSQDFPAAAEDLARVRAANLGDGITHVAGGVHATAEPLATLQAGFDLVALGEGESTMVALYRSIEESRDPRTLAGVAFLDEGRLVSHGPGERRPLDEFQAFNLRHGKWNALEITRGCVYACSFCQTPYMFKARFRHRSVENVRWHVDELRKQGSRFVRFLTPTSLSYGSDDERVNLDAIEALLANVREAAGGEAKIYFGTFPSEIRPEHISTAALKLLKKYASNRTVIIGGQSGSQRVLDETRRGHSVDDVVRAVELCVAEGIRPDVDLLLGLPSETADDRQRSLELARKLISMGARIHSHAFMPLPGTPLRGRVPTEIEPEITLEMARLESQGAMYGQWRTQVVSANDLLRRHRASRSD